MRNLLIMLVVASGTLTAQSDDQGLTSEFSKLSAKERSRIAKEEQEGSRNDPAYQAAMAAAESFFQQDRYEEALERYKEARALRPLNVYPKVKIQDMQALIEKRDQQPAPVVDDRVPDPPSPAGPAPATPPPASADHVAPAPTTPVVVRERPVAAPSIEKTPEVSAAPPQDGIRETRYQLGTSHVTEREVTEEGTVILYKRVAHHWGQVYYFQDGQPVDERVWRERFRDR